MDLRRVIIGGIGVAALMLGALLLTYRLAPRPQMKSPRALPATGLDSGYDATSLANVVASTEQGAPGSELWRTRWMRIRDIDIRKVTETREALGRLRAQGIRTCVFLRRSVPDWKRKYLPDDLREAYENGHNLGAAFGDMVDAWEIDNEPDLGFVPESAERYTAFLKASYLGLKAGAAMAEERSAKGKGLSALPLAPSSSPLVTKGPLVLMGSLGLPPGPWLERFAGNDGFVYTDGFNYHYYGYADDFTGVYHQHEAAVKVLTTDYTENTDKNTSANSATSVIKKDLSVFMTEIGYGMLGKEARDTKEGRLRQWRWFKSVGKQRTNLRIEAAMAFYLRPYLEYETSEYGLSVPAQPDTEKPETRKLKAEGWTAGGIQYTAADFQEVGRAAVPNAPPESWMKLIGQHIGGNDITPALAWWMSGPRSVERSEVGRVVPNAPSDPGGLGIIRPTNRGASRSWSVSTPPPSPIVIDFLPGAGLSHVKRYNGSFVTGKSPEIESVIPNAPSGQPEPPKPLPTSPSSSATPRSEDFILQIRTRNGNLYEVYPTRQATPDWQRFMEPGGNFTMAFYGRAALPWRFEDNKPASLVVVMYPKKLPAVYEFCRPQLIKLSVPSSQPSANYRYGAGSVVLYNFSDKPISGRLKLPEVARRVAPNAPGAGELIILQPGERREVSVSIKVSWGHYEPIKAPITFVPEDTNIPAARYLTALIPDIGGVPATLVANLLPQEVGRVAASAEVSRDGWIPDAPSNREIVRQRPRASEEAPMIEQGAFFVQEGTQLSAHFATVSNNENREQTPTDQQAGTANPQLSDSFTVTVNARSPGKPQRIEVEIPWPDDLTFSADSFLSMEFRLHN